MSSRPSAALDEGQVVQRAGVTSHAAYSRKGRKALPATAGCPPAKGTDTTRSAMLRMGSFRNEKTMVKVQPSTACCRVGNLDRHLCKVRLLEGQNVHGNILRHHGHFLCCPVGHIPSPHPQDRLSGGQAPVRPITGHGWWEPPAAPHQGPATRAPSRPLCPSLNCPPLTAPQPGHRTMPGSWPPQMAASPQGSCQALLALIPMWRCPS